MNSERKTTEDLILQHLTDGLDAGGQRELAAALQQSEDARRLLASYLRVEAGVLRLARGQALSQPSLLSEHALAEQTSAGSVNHPAGAHSSWKQWIAYALAASAAIALAALLWPFGANTPSLPDGPTVPVAYLTRAIDARWEGASQPEVGTALKPQRVSLQDGVAEIEFVSGATVILEGPAKLDLVSPDCGFLHYGRLRTVVPPEAFGFTVSSASRTVVDLGTEFGFDVDQVGAVEIHVFDGEVEIYNGPQTEEGTPQILAAGEALRFEPGGERSVMLADSNAFVGRSVLELRAVAFIGDLDDQLRSLQKRQREVAKREKELLAEIRQSPELEKLRNEAQNAESAVHDAARKHRPVQRAEEGRQKARKQLEKLIDQKLAESDQGRAILDRLAELDEQIAELKEITQQRQSKPDGDRKPEAKGMAKSLRNAVRQRGRQNQLLRKLRQNVRKKDEDVREALNRFSAKRKAVNEATNRSVVGKLRQERTKTRRRYNEQLKKLLRENQQLSAIREQKKVLAGKMQSLRKQMREANTGMTTTTALVDSHKSA